MATSFSQLFALLLHADAQAVALVSSQQASLDFVALALLSPAKSAGAAMKDAMTIDSSDFIVRWR
jgi:hypothetical protein